MPDYSGYFQVECVLVFFLKKLNEYMQIIGGKKYMEGTNEYSTEKHDPQHNNKTK